MVAKVPDLAPQVDVLLGNLEDAIPAANKEAARAGLVQIAQTADLGGTALWTRVNDLGSPWVLDDLTAVVTEAGEQIDVVMVPKVEGPEDIHYVDRLLAQLEAKAGISRPAAGPRHPRDRPRRRQRRGDLRRLPADAGHLARAGRPRRQPPDEDDPGRRWSPRLPGAPGPAGRRRRRGRRSSRTCGTTRSRGWSTPARCTASTPTTGRSATSRTSRPARTSSATPTCSAASAPGRCTRSRSTSPRRSSRPSPTRSPGPAGRRARWARTAAAR